MTITPAVNMVSNFGFGRPDAVHTTNYRKPAPTQDIWELRHPPRVVVDSEADSFTFRHHYFPLRRRIKYTLMGVLGRVP